MKIETFACDICGVQKKDANHWFKASKVSQDGKPAGVLIGHWNTRFHMPNIPQMQAVRNFFDADVIAHLCGADCVTQWLSKTLLGQTS